MGQVVVVLDAYSRVTCEGDLDLAALLAVSRKHLLRARSFPHLSSFLKPPLGLFSLQNEISVNCPRKQEALVQLPAVSSQVGASTFPATQTKGQLTWVSGGMCCSQVSVGPA